MDIGGEALEELGVLSLSHGPEHGGRSPASWIHCKHTQRIPTSLKTSLNITIYTRKKYLGEVNSESETHTICNIGDFTQDVVSADFFISLWWADEGLTDHGDVDFSTDTPVCRLWKEI